MSVRGFCAVLLSAAALFTVSAVAQDENNEISGVIGRTFIGDQGIQNETYFDPIIHSGKGLTFGGEYARRFWVTPLWAGQPDFPFRRPQPPAQLLCRRRGVAAFLAPLLLARQ